jgi:hypothetical protein
MESEPIVRLKSVDPELIAISLETEPRMTDLFKPSSVTVSGISVGYGFRAYNFITTNFQTGMSLVASVEEVLKRITSLQVAILNLSDVRGYLTNHPDLLWIIEDICDQTVREFAYRAKISLEVVRDPEIDWSEIVLFVRQEEYSPDILEEIDRFIEKNDYILELSGNLRVSTDFQPPK